VRVFRQTPKRRSSLLQGQPPDAWPLPNCFRRYAGWEQGSNEAVLLLANLGPVLGVMAPVFGSRWKGGGKNPHLYRGGGTGRGGAPVFFGCSRRDGLPGERPSSRLGWRPHLHQLFIRGRVLRDHSQIQKGFTWLYEAALPLCGGGVLTGTGTISAAQEAYNRRAGQVPSEQGPKFHYGHSSCRLCFLWLAGDTAHLCLMQGTCCIFLAPPYLTELTYPAQARRGRILVQLRYHLPALPCTTVTSAGRSRPWRDRLGVPARHESRS